MNYLETIIKDFLLNTDISDITVKDVAQKFYVSRALVYKVIGKWDYTSFETFKAEIQEHEKLQFEALNAKIVNCQNEIEALVLTITFSKIVYIVSYGITKTAGKYMTRQLINLGCLAINIDDSTTIGSYNRLIGESDLIIYLSLDGEVSKTKRFPTKYVRRYIFAPENSEISMHEKNVIVFESNRTNLSSHFEQESVVSLLEQIDVTLSGIKVQKMKSKVTKLSDVENNTN